MDDLTILRIYDIISEYCINKRKSVLYYEIEYGTEEEKQEIINFYKDKLPLEILESINKDDDNFILFNKAQSAIEYAESVFPYLPEISVINPKFHISTRVFDVDGSILWENGD